MNNQQQEPKWLRLWNQLIQEVNEHKKAESADKSEVVPK